MDEPRELTWEEVRERFLDRVRGEVDYWKTYGNGDIEKSLNGLALSILMMIDGEDSELPAFILSPDPRKDDRAYNASEGKNWFPTEPHRRKMEYDIAGELHEKFYKKENTL